MHILITGAGGMLGRKLAAALAQAGALGGRPVTRLTLADRIAPPLPRFDGQAEALVLDNAAPDAPERLLAGRPEVVFHLASSLSAESEADFELGYRVNLDATRAILERIRAIPGYCPRLVFASTAAVYGTPFPDTLPDNFHLAPASSYGTQKAILELLINDYSRKGFLDGISLRLPTICIRPGAPNGAASGFFSSILREPLAGKPAILPVRDTLRHWFASPRAATGFFLHAGVLDTAALGTQRGVMMPGLSATVAEEIEALRRVAGQGAVDLIRVEPDARIAAIVETWAGGYEARRAQELGFRAEASFDEIIRVYLEDERPG
jgi:nucleoside-diphosphate-sugar epimerase